MIIFRTLTRYCFSTLPALIKYLQPVTLTLRQSSQLPILKLKSQKYLLQNWWSEKPFELPQASPMSIPVFSFLDGKYLSQHIQLPQDIFNYPLRRDLIYRLYDFRIKLDKFTTKHTRNRAMTHGSGRKMRAQKGQGIARMGDKRAPHLFKGGKVHGAKPRVFSYPLNAKIKLNALKALLTAKLAEGKIKIVDSQAISEGKTKIIEQVFQSHINDERGILCVITSKNFDANFQKAQRNHPRILWHDTYNLDVFSLFKADKILITQKGLEELIENIYKTIYIIYRQPHMPEVVDKKVEEVKSETEFDPSQPYEFKFKILAEYMEKYEKIKRQNPELLTKQLFKAKRRPIITGKTV